MSFCLAIGIVTRIVFYSEELQRQKTLGNLFMGKICTKGCALTGHVFDAAQLWVASIWRDVRFSLQFSFSLSVRSDKGTINQYVWESKCLFCLRWMLVMVH